MEFVKEIEQAECEGGSWPMPGGREPPSPEQLDARGDRRAVRPAFAVGYVDRMNAGEVEDCEGDEGGGYGAGPPVVVAEVEDGTQVS